MLFYKDSFTSPLDLVLARAVM